MAELLHSKTSCGPTDAGYNGSIRGSRGIPFREYFIIYDKSVLNAIDAIDVRRAKLG
jgi:hypothetical protein